MLYEIMKAINNFFLTGLSKSGTFTIEGGTISLPFVKEGQYILIEGSVSNDGIYKYPCTTLKNEVFDGRIAVCAPPKSFIDLCDEIKAYNDANKASAFTSESFGGYSYTKATSASGAPATYRDVFRARLNSWRKM